ncbi:MAG: DHH family phosphoesterase [archaeon]
MISKEGLMLIDKIKGAVKKIDSLSRSKSLRVISHFDSDGITSAAIFARALFRWGKKFNLEIVKGLDEEYVKNLGDEEVLIFLDLGSGSLDAFGKKKTEVIILDHHELGESTEIPENVCLVNSNLEGEERLSGAAVCYLFAKEVSGENRDLANLAVIGMVGDLHEKEIGLKFGEIIRDSETTVKKGLLIYPSTRPLNRVLEYSSSPYIPGVTGSREGVFELLREAQINNGEKKYKALYELDEEEMKRLSTAIMLRGKGASMDEVVGNLFLIKFFNKLEDARELSALINACSRMGSPETALGFCLGNRIFKEDAEKIYIDYKQALFSALKFVTQSEKVEGNGYMIINARDNVKDTIIGTVASILSHSPLYPKGQMIVALAYNEDKIKVSARLSGRKGRNVREVLSRAVVSLGGEVGGHPQAAGCLISRDKEEEFIGELRRVLEVEEVRV